MENKKLKIKQKKYLTNVNIIIKINLYFQKNIQRTDDMQHNNDNFQVHKQFADFKDKNVLIGLKNWEELEGKIIAIDNFLNIVLEINSNLKVIKGGKIAFISIKE